MMSTNIKNSSLGYQTWVAKLSLLQEIKKLCILYPFAVIYRLSEIWQARSDSPI